nr:hypothetical protein B0A51_08113 [Rachicladosporium sp. CCFEE 5018]
MKLTATIPILASVATIANAAPLEKRAGTSYNGGNTANDVVNKICAPVTLIFARGSTESGNMGSSVGPALAKALISQLGASGVAIQGVDYEATIASNANMGSGGGPVMASLAKQALSQCPNTKIAISGYSQGGTVTHYAVKSAGLSPDSVSSAVLFGDPLLRQSVGSLPARKVKEFLCEWRRCLRGWNFLDQCRTSLLHLQWRYNSWCPVHRAAGWHKLGQCLDHRIDSHYQHASYNVDSTCSFHVGNSCGFHTKDYQALVAVVVA